MKKKLILIILLLNFFNTSTHSKNNLYEKIDLFDEVLENIQKVINLLMLDVMLVLLLRLQDR